MKGFIKIPKKRKYILKRDKNKIKKIEDLTETKIEIDEDVSIDGESFNVFQTKQVMKAFGRGFEVKVALDLLDDNYGLEIINLPDLINSEKRMIVVKSRIIGSNGKTKKIIEEMTETKLAIQGKTVSILGKWDNISISKEAIMKLINGCSHQNLYSWLEKNSVVNR